MTFSDWLEETQKKYRQSGVRVAAKGATQELYQGSLKRAFSRINYRPSVWERDWEVLVILDGCRIDALRSVVAEDSRFPNAEEVQRVISPASTSAEFMWSQFTCGPADKKAETALVCSNPHMAKCEGVSEDQWFRVEDVWRPHSDSGDIDATPPRAVTDVAIDVGRESAPERMIVWYMQPHFPARTLNETGVFKKIRDGEINRDRAWEAYIDNIQYVLDEVALLLENLDAETVAITADHGENFGEYGVYGHAPNIPTPQLKLVPWLTVSGQDTGSHSPSYNSKRKDRSETVDVDDRLSALGYK